MAAPDLGDGWLAGVAVIVKGEPPRQELERHHAGSPHVRLGVDVALEGLRGHEPAGCSGQGKDDGTNKVTGRLLLIARCPPLPLPLHS